MQLQEVVSGDAMLKNLIMPRLGDDSSDGCVEEWKKAVGESVELGEPICVVSTDKVAFDLESPFKGTLAEILVEPQAIVPPGTVLCRIKLTE